MNAEVASWNKSPRIDSSLLLSLMFKDNVEEDELSAQSSYTIDINDSNYIDNLAPHPENFDNKVHFGDNTLKKVYTQLITALNDVRVQKSTNSTLSAIWNRKISKYFYPFGGKLQKLGNPYCGPTNQPTNK
jgi:hypothetical protein